MYANLRKIVLASGSPRRRDFLKDMGLEFVVESADIDESPLPWETPDRYATRLAREKCALVAARHPNDWVVSGDTVVTLDGKIYAKPEDSEDAVRMLLALSGRAHQVMTGFCVMHHAGKQERCEVVCTEVVFAAFSEAEARAYAGTGEPLDKAGGYGIQGKGGFLVEEIRGSYSNVVGLPVRELIETLLHYQVIVATDR